MNDPELYARTNSSQFKDNSFVLEKYLKNMNFKNDKNNVSILDIGAGDGYTTLNLLLPKIPRKVEELIGIDVSENMVNYATRHCQRPNVNFYQMDIAKDNVKAAGFYKRFDHAFSFFCLHWVEDKRAAYQNIFDMLVTDGDFLAVYIVKSFLCEAFVKISKFPRWHSQFPKNICCFDNIEKEVATEKILKETGFVNYFCRVEQKSYTFNSTTHFQQRREIQKYSEWRQLWYPNFEDYNRAEAIAGTENNTVTNVTVQLGATAYLHCHVRSTGDRVLSGSEQVSWVRRRDWHILSSGVFTYTNDERFQILHAEGSDDWTLQIKYVQKRDNGTYECQVSNSQGLLSHFVNLEIVVPEATIQGGRSGEHHVDVGSVIDLVCVIEKSPTPPQYVFWYHNDRMINYDTARGGISVETVPGPRTQSRLTITNTNDADSGNYTCSASNTEAASINVFVSEGDNVDAILMRKSCAMCVASQLVILLIATFTAAMR